VSSLVSLFRTNDGRARNQSGHRSSNQFVLGSELDAPYGASLPLTFVAYKMVIKKDPKLVSSAFTKDWCRTCTRDVVFLCRFQLSLDRLGTVYSKYAVTTIIGDSSYPPNVNYTQS